MTHANVSPSTPDAPYPGRLLRDLLFPALQITVSQAARELGLSRQSLYRILDGTTPITPETAARLGRFCDVPASFWLHLQCECDLRRIEASLPRGLPVIAKRTLSARVWKQLGATGGR
jgi:addiction module HigA family antidote